jgi:hypothetical protein
LVASSVDLLGSAFDSNFLLCFVLAIACKALITIKINITYSKLRKGVISTYSEQSCSCCWCYVVERSKLLMALLKEISEFGEVKYLMK